MLFRTQKKPILCIADFDRRVVLVNPSERRPDTDDLEHVLGIYLHNFGLEGILYSSPFGNTYLQIETNKKRALNISRIQNFNQNVGIAIMKPNNGQPIVSIRIVEDGKVVMNYSEIATLMSILGGE